MKCFSTIQLFGLSKTFTYLGILFGNNRLQNDSSNSTRANSNQIQVKLDRQLQHLVWGMRGCLSLSSLFLEGIIHIGWNVTTLIFWFCLSLRKHYRSLRTIFVTIVKATIFVENMLMDKLHWKDMDQLVCRLHFNPTFT